MRLYVLMPLDSHYKLKHKKRKSLAHVSQGTKMPYTLEVVRFLVDKEEWMSKGSKHEHVGYMRVLFKTKQMAADYYNVHNKHMRKLDIHDTWRSDWDPETKLFFIVRQDHDIVGTYPPFDLQDEPIITRFEDGFDIEYPTMTTDFIKKLKIQIEEAILK